MATRSGSLDPGLVLWLQEHVGTPSEELAAALEHRSGLLGLAGTADMREVLIAAGVRDDDAADASGPATTIVPADARLALDVYVHRLRAGIAAMAAALGGLDAVAFTGGVGRERAGGPPAGGRGPRLPRVWPSTAARNENGDGDREIGAAGSRRQELRRRVARGPRDRPVGAARPGSGAPPGPAAGVHAGGLSAADKPDAPSGGGTVDQLLTMRRDLGKMRRRLSPHRQVFGALAHPSFDVVSGSSAAAEFAVLAERLETALQTIDTTREMIFGSFDVIMSRTAQRTNDIMRVLTMVSVVLLPATLIAGVFGMNMLPKYLLESWVFWAVLGLMLVVAGGLLLSVRAFFWRR